MSADAATRPADGPKNSIGAGGGRTLTALYALFALAATGRSTVQLATHADRAPLAYSLSVAAAVIYLVATVSLMIGNRGRTAATVACTVELGGVTAVGMLSYLTPEAFPDRTVWSHFGQGYGYLPAVLPVAGLWWLWHSKRAPHQVRR